MGDRKVGSVAATSRASWYRLAAVGLSLTSHARSPRVRHATIWRDFRRNSLPELERAVFLAWVEQKLARNLWALGWVSAIRLKQSLPENPLVGTRIMRLTFCVVESRVAEVGYEVAESQREGFGGYICGHIGRAATTREYGLENIFVFHDLLDA